VIDIIVVALFNRHLTAMFPFADCNDDATATCLNDFGEHILQSMLSDPDIIVAVGNGWWTASSSIVAIQRASAVAWARLFDKSLIISFNT